MDARHLMHFLEIVAWWKYKSQSGKKIQSENKSLSLIVSKNTSDQFVKCIAYNEVNLQDHIVHAKYFPSSTLWVK